VALQRRPAPESSRDSAPAPLQLRRWHLLSLRADDHLDGDDDRRDSQDPRDGVGLGARSRILAINRRFGLSRSGEEMSKLRTGADRRREPIAVPDHLRVEGKEALLDHPFQFLAGERDALVAEQAIGHRSQIVAPVGVGGIAPVSSGACDPTMC
jgi:hypothetical protein